MMHELVVVGLGYVGLPLARAASAGRAGCGRASTSTRRVVDRPERGPIAHRRPVRRRCRQHDRRWASPRPADPTVAEPSRRTIVICVPTPLSDEGGPDLRAVTAATATIGGPPATRHPGDPGVHDLPRHHRDRHPPLLEARSGLVAGAGLPPGLLARAGRPGQPDVHDREHPQGGGRADRRRAPSAARDFYARFIDTVVVAKGTREAETAKLLENTYRHVNIALVNEMARFCHELGHRPLGRDPAGQHQAVRLPGVLSRSRGGRPLHPDRPELPEPRGPVGAGLPVPVRRAGAGDQRDHAGLRGAPHPERAQRRRPSRARLVGPAARGHLQGQHRRPAGVSGGRLGPAPARSRSRRDVPRPVRQELVRVPRGASGVAICRRPSPMQI